MMLQRIIYLLGKTKLFARPTITATSRIIPNAFLGLVNGKNTQS